ncbi:MAG: HlyD family type I secretion periplasmic adaptor subunit [Rhodospirillaceae bacterium]
MSSGAFDRVLTRRPQRGWGALSLLVVLALAAAVGWASVTHLEEVSVADGEVVPQGATKIVQHLEGGIVEELFVREGDVVTLDAPLLRLGLGTGSFNRTELEVRKDGLALRRARLAAEANGSELVFPDDALGRQPQLASAEQEAFHSRNRELETALSVIAEQISQRASEIRGIENAILTGREQLAIAREKLQISTDLLKDGLTSRLEHLDAQRDAGALAGEQKALAEKLIKARAALAEAQARRREVRERFENIVREELGTVEVELRSIGEFLAEATAQTGRTLVRSPIEGTVKNLRYTTIGGVVRPGDPILEIVPERDRLVVEARLDPADRGYVRVGQPALVKLTTYDYVRYGGIEGEVVRIAPDSDLTPAGRPFFRVVVETQRTWLGDETGALPITVGMPATVDIKTGERTVIDYLLRPVLKLKSEAFRER